MINHVQLEKRKDFARDWRKEHANKYGKLPFMFSDEKIFTVNGGLNMQLSTCIIKRILVIPFYFFRISQGIALAEPHTLKFSIYQGNILTFYSFSKVRWSC
jgi:hypothetical protein